jgi:hypothetical protein
LRTFCRSVAEVVFESCSKPGGVHRTLLPYALVALCLYSITFPVVLFVVMYQRRYKIMQDQLLRAEERGDSKLENPDCYVIRKTYHK